MFLHRKLTQTQRARFAANSKALQVAIKKIKKDGSTSVSEPELELATFQSSVSKVR